MERGYRATTNYSATRDFHGLEYNDKKSVYARARQIFVIINRLLCASLSSMTLLCSADQGPQGRSWQFVEQSKKA